MSAHERPSPPPALAVGPLAALAGGRLLLHVLLAGRYGYFRDELYFLDCGRHLDWGYVDHAPLIGLLSRAMLELGAPLQLLRITAGIAGAALVALTMVLARALGGGRFAQTTAGLAVAILPIHLAISSLFSMNVLEPLLWTGCALALVEIERSGDSRLWLAFGLLAGIGLETKHSMLFFGAAVAAAVVLTPLRRELARPWIWVGGALALLLFSPNLLWQIQHAFPTLEDLRNVRESGKNVELAPLAFVAEQIVIVHPVLLPLWAAGLASLLVGSLRRFRALAIVYLVLLGLMMTLHGKSYYLAPAYPMLLAAGGRALEHGLARVSRGRRLALQTAVLVVVAAAGAAMAPLFLPLLDPPAYVAYQERLGLAPSRTEVAHVGPLPQFLGDQLGWPELVAEVARVYHALPPEEREAACIFAGNYGEAGAVNLLGPAHGLPPAISGHQTHFLWGPGDCTGEVIIALQTSAEEAAEIFASVEVAGRHHHPWGMAEENGAILVCRGLEPPIAELWPRVKHWN